MDANKQLALAMAMGLRARGWNPLPSVMDGPRKKPIYPYAHLREQQAPAEWFTEEAWDTTNLQCMTGRFWGLLVVDLDGCEAIEQWDRMGKCPPTWIVHRNGKDSRHVWFRIPKDLPKPMPTCFVWKGPGKHEGIERMCDKGLIVCPPSFHVEHKDSRYKFLDTRHSPERLPMPCWCPDWVLRLQPINLKPEVIPERPPMVRSVPAVGEGRFSPDEVREAIRDKVAMARQWGLRVAGRPNAEGWTPCKSIDRDDTHPSAAINSHSGYYVDLGNGRRLAFFDLMAELMRLPSWKEAFKELGAKLL